MSLYDLWDGDMMVFFFLLCWFCQEAVVPDCSGVEFSSPALEHVIVVIDAPFVVRSIQGKINTFVDKWPEGHSLTLEFEEADGEKARFSTQADGNGSFEITHDVKPGYYCFEAWSNGWDSIYGVILVTDDADEDAIVTFDMHLG